MNKNKYDRLAADHLSKQSQSIHCSWHGKFTGTKMSAEGKLCCPFCGVGPLSERGENQFWRDAEAKERSGHCGFVAFVKWCVQNNKRYQTIEEVADALAAFSDTRPPEHTEKEEKRYILMTTRRVDRDDDFEDFKAVLFAHGFSSRAEAEDYKDDMDAIFCEGMFEIPVCYSVVEVDPKTSQICARTEYNILRVIESLADQLWYDRHLFLNDQLKQEGEILPPEILNAGEQVLARNAARGKPGPLNDYELGELHGKLSALSWIMGGGWGEADADVSFCDYEMHGNS